MNHTPGPAERPCIAWSEWLEVMETEYLGRYVCDGGSAVKFISGSDAVLAATVTELVARAAGRRFWTVQVAAGELTDLGQRPDPHRIDRLFCQVTRGVDWRAWAAEQARGFLRSRGLQLADRVALADIDRIAADNGRSTEDLLREYQRDFATPQLRDRHLSVEFRTAVTALGRAQLMPDALTPSAEQVLLAWFGGQPLPGAAGTLKRVGLFSRINQSNARHLLASFARWLPHAGYSGLLLVLDFRAYEHKRLTASARRDEHVRALHEAIARGASTAELQALVAAAEHEPAVMYSDAAYLQMLALLRRFIDEVDSFQRLLLVVLTTPGFYDGNSRRNYYNYDALQTRIGLEVHDARRANPAACLVHLGDSR